MNDAQRKILQQERALSRKPDLRRGEVIDATPGAVTVALGGSTDEVPAQTILGANVAVGDIVDVLAAGNRPPLILAAGSPAARVYNSANISIPNATLTALTFNSERFDNDSIHSTASNTSRLTATTAGVYSISGNFTMAPLGSGIGLIGVRLNGSLIIAYQRFAGITATNLIQAIQTTYKLAAGDYVELIAHQDSGSALNVIAASNYSPEFSMHKVSDG